MQSDPYRATLGDVEVSARYIAKDTLQIVASKGGRTETRTMTRREWYAAYDLEDAARPLIERLSDAD
jgi:hypothetical protein